MQALITLHVPDGIAITQVVADGDVIGRDSNCQARVDHVSVSRRHARIERLTDGHWQVVDLDSKNGLRRDGERMQLVPLASGNWFAVGDVYVRFDLLDADQALARASSIERRRTQSQTMRALLQGDPRSEGVVERSLAAFVRLAECRRGFVLLGNGRDDLRVRAALHLDAETSPTNSFDGSHGAVERCLRERRPVYLSNLPDAAWLRGRPSIIAGGVRALACLPLRNGGDLLGALYADTDVGVRVFDELDAELLGAFADEVGNWLAASALDARVDALAVRLASSDKESSQP